MHTLSELRRELDFADLHLQKDLGQHYLIDPLVTKKMAGACRLGPTDTVVEIGAGLGALTDLLAQRAKQVIAVEIDARIAHRLAARLAQYANVTVACEDILNWPWQRYRGCKVVGAIPYQISSAILVDLCEQRPGATDAWLALQHEVARRLVAAPGTKAYGRLPLLVQFRFQVQQLFRIPKRAFFPVPRVDSAWVHLAARAQPAVSVAHEGLLFELIKAAFGQRRKTLLNALRTLRPALDRTSALRLLNAAGCAERVRGEELSLAEFAAVADALYRADK